METPPKAIILIPTYNESENVGTLVPAVLSIAPHYEILIIDDGSPDGTADLVKAMMPQFDGRLHLMERKQKAGLGTAYIAGFKWALERNYDLVFEMDCDFSHPPTSLPALEDACVKEANDIAVGSRYTKGGKVQNWPMNRLMLSYGASLYVRLITGMPVKDPTAGFICYKSDILRKLNLDRVRFIGYAFQIEMKYKSFLKGAKIKEVPITFKDREKGVSKMSTKIFKEGLLGVVILRMEKAVRLRNEK
jgi:dolichol-phosphate mannosyltransferase